MATPKILRQALVAILLLAAVAIAGEPERPGTFVVNREAHLYDRPSADARIVNTLRAGTVIEVVRVTDQWYEVRSTRGNPNGFIRSSYADPSRGRTRGGRAFRPGIFALKEPAIVRQAPEMLADRIAVLEPGTTVRVVGRSGNWYRVESSLGRPPGYIPVIAAERVRDLDDEPAGPAPRTRDLDRERPDSRPPLEDF